MNSTSHFDGSFMPLLTALMLLTVIAVFAIRAYASTRAARSSMEDQASQNRLARLESELAETKSRLKAMEDMLNDV